MADVRCPSCGEIYHETTVSYIAGGIITGDMLRLKAQYVDNGLYSFPESRDTRQGEIECPQCGGPYLTQDGRALWASGQVEPKEKTRRTAAVPARSGQGVLPGVTGKKTRTRKWA